ncbi:LuxR C-terminal-related transcriptional regulator [Cognatishimia sp.]|uniref:LuxR C-terminal-related transcriptional regulator n=1 Tax=Cognatishimia sp. TaxID=2211648 RepID=UPI0035147566
METLKSIAFDAAPIGIIMTEHRIVRTCNRKFCHLSGFDRSDLIGQSFRSLLYDDAEYERVREFGFKALRAGGSYSDMRLLRRKDESLLWCRFRAETLTPEDPLARMVFTYAPVGEPTNQPTLSPREWDVVLGLHAGKTSKAIALDLGLSPRTVEDVRARLLKKFQAKNSMEMLKKFTNIEI